MKKETKEFIGFCIVFLLFYIATKVFSEAKVLSDWLLVLGILYLAYKISKRE